MGPEAAGIFATQWRETLDLVALHWGAIKRTAEVLAVKDITTSDDAVRPYKCTNPPLFVKQIYRVTL